MNAVATLQRGSSADPAGSMRDRFVAFAFTAADLLVEAAPGGLISFAAGAFLTRLGSAPDAFIGRHLSELIAPVDQASFRVVMAIAATRGRSPPMLVRLADRRQTTVSVSSLMIPGSPARLCLTFGPVPAAASDGTGQPAPAFALGTAPIAAAASLRMAADASPSDQGQLGLLELKGWATARRAMGSAEHDQLRAEIGAALATCAPGSLASEVAEGRFSVLAPAEFDLKQVVDRLESLLGASRCNGLASVTGVGVPLAAAALEPAQKVRALRFALTCFAERGNAGALGAGAGAGLSGIMQRAETRAQGLRQAIADGRFALLFQPVVALDGRQVHHYEALLRPKVTPNNPSASPQEYVNFAELVGLAEELDAAVLSRAIDTLHASPRVSVAVNMSGLSIQNPASCERALDAIKNARLGGRLLIELTETAEISDMVAAAGHMAQLRAADVPLCLDDFGAGAASFRYLREFAVDFVKIDGSYVRQAPHSPRERGFVGSIVDLAVSVHAATVAEMIETEQEADLMRELGVGFGQGWLLGRPGRLPG